MVRPSLSAAARPTSYNLERSHQGYRLRGRTPAQAMCEALGIDALPPLWTTDDDRPKEGDDDHAEAA